MKGMSWRCSLSQVNILSEERRIVIEHKPSEVALFIFTVRVEQFVPIYPDVTGRKPPGLGLLVISQTKPFDQEGLNIPASKLTFSTRPSSARLLRSSAFLTIRICSKLVSGSSAQLRNKITSEMFHDRVTPSLATGSGHSATACDHDHH